MGSVEKRLFTAIELPDTWRRAIGDLRSALTAQGVQARFVPIERLHMTLNFIGETTKEKAIVEAFESIDRSCSPSFSLSEGGLFHRRRGGELLVWELDCDPLLLTYRERERKMLGTLGLPTDDRSFRPHLTLARDAEGAFLRSPDYKRLFVPQQPHFVHEVVLFESRFEAGRLRYFPCQRFSFGA